jgi:beta-ureidopropionase / N-carbamoyl-L-amino-acid hydrolase
VSARPDPAHAEPARAALCQEGHLHDASRHEGGLPDIAAAAFDRMWTDLAAIGRHPGTGGYRRYAWTREDAELHEWFAGEAATRGLDLVDDRAGNLWAWWGDPDGDGPGVVLGSHLDSVPDGGAFDGPLGVVSALAAVDALRAGGFTPARPLGIAVFGDEEGARFGVACAGSRLLTGALAPDRARGLTDGDGVRMAEALRRAGRDPDGLGRDDAAVRRIGAFVELHVEQGRALAEEDPAEPGRAVGVGTGIWPHGRWRIELPGEANHAGTTALEDRRDPMIAFASVVLAARGAAAWHDALATCGKVAVAPNGVNAVPSSVTGWLDARAPRSSAVQAVVRDVAAVVEVNGGAVVEESWTEPTAFDAGMARRLAALLGDAPRLATGAGHDAGVLAAAGIPTAMLFVRNPTGVSHSPAEHAERADCLAGVAALTAVAVDLTGARPGPAG